MHHWYFYCFPNFTHCPRLVSYLLQNSCVPEIDYFAESHEVDAVCAKCYEDSTYERILGIAQHNKEGYDKASSIGELAVPKDFFVLLRHFKIGLVYPYIFLPGAINTPGGMQIEPTHIFSDPKLNSTEDGNDKGGIDLG